jgi:hypothetical protein
MISIITKTNISIINNTDFKAIKFVYNIFDNNVYICKSWYPKAFLETLEFKDDIYQTTYKNLQYMFILYCQKVLRTTFTYQNFLTFIKNMFEFHPFEYDLTNKPDKTNKPELTLIRKSLDMPNIPEDHELNTCKLDYAEIDVIKIDKVANFNLNTCRLMICFYNKITNKHKIAYLNKSQDYDERIYLKYLNYIKNIEIKFIAQFPINDLTYSLCNYYFSDNLPDLNTYLNTLLLKVYTIYKFLNGKNNGTVIKSVIEFLYSNYEYDFESSISIQDVYENYCSENCNKFRFSLNIFVDITRFYDILKYIFCEINDNKILNIKKRSEKIKLNLEFDSKLKTMLRTPYIKQKTYQLRSEPVCIGFKVSPWNESSHVDYVNMWMGKLNASSI